MCTGITINYRLRASLSPVWPSEQATTSKLPCQRQLRVNSWKVALCHRNSGCLGMELWDLLAWFPRPWYCCTSVATSVHLMWAGRRGPTNDAASTQHSSNWANIYHRLVLLAQCSHKNFTSMRPRPLNILAIFRTRDACNYRCNCNMSEGNHRAKRTACDSKVLRRARHGSEQVGGAICVRRGSYWR